MKQLIRIIIIVTVMNCIVAVSQSLSSNSALESIAINYMTAFNKGDFEEVVSLMHPETIKNLKYDIIREYEKQSIEGRVDKFKSETNITKNLNELKKMDDSDVAVYLMRQNRIMAIKNSPMAVGKMQYVVVKAIGKEKIDDKTYRVKFNMVLPEDDKSIISSGEFIIKNVNGAWKVYSN